MIAVQIVDTEGVARPLDGQGVFVADEPSNWTIAVYRTERKWIVSSQQQQDFAFELHYGATIVPRLFLPLLPGGSIAIQVGCSATSKNGLLTSMPSKRESWAVLVCAYAWRGVAWRGVAWRRIASRRVASRRIVSCAGAMRAEAVRGDVCLAVPGGVGVAVQGARRCAVRDAVVRRCGDDGRWPAARAAARHCGPWLLLLTPRRQSGAWLRVVYHPVVRCGDAMHFGGAELCMTVHGGARRCTAVCVVAWLWRCSA